jgi:hypothetical protein
MLATGGKKKNFPITKKGTFSPLKQFGGGGGHVTPVPPGSYAPACPHNGEEPQCCTAPWLGPAGSLSNFKESSKRACLQANSL